MLLTARPLTAVDSVNSFRYADYFELIEGDAADLYFILGDVSKDLRYMPAVGALLSATINHLDDAKKVTRSCTQPFVLDPSIWKLQVLATDYVRGTLDLKLTLTEGAVVTHCNLRNIIRVKAPTSF